MVEVKIFPVGLHDGETPPEVERAINEFLKDKSDCKVEFHVGGDFILVVVRKG